MTKLEEDLDLLREFDRTREIAAGLRDHGWNLLRESERASPMRNPPEPADILATAEVLKALLTRRALAMSSGVLDELTSALEKVSRERALSSEPDNIPVLRSAKAMCALAAAPDSAFSSSVMYFLYNIVRKIYVATPPDWSVGGARAGENAAHSGYVTWQCVRVIVDFQLLSTAPAELKALDPSRWLRLEEVRERVPGIARDTVRVHCSHVLRCRHYVWYYMDEAAEVAFARPTLEEAVAARATDFVSQISILPMRL